MGDFQKFFCEQPEEGWKFNPLVITGLVPVIPMKKSVALHTIGMAGTSPAMTWEGMAPEVLHSRGKR